MGKLVEQPLSTFFQGVSRQPDTVRHPGQVEEADNAVFSVVTGGFEKRPGTLNVSKLTAIPNVDTLAVHMYDRDAIERYVVIVDDGELYVYDVDGNAKTVTFPDGKDYLFSADPANEFSFVTIADYTLVLNKTIEVALQGTTATTVNGPVKSFADLPREGETVPEYLTSYAAGVTWAGTDTGCSNGSVWKVSPDDGERLGYYFVKVDTSTSPWTWEESVDPNFPNAFDATTMPHQLVRNADGTFTFAQATWSERLVGDPDVVPNPDFVGLALSDITFFRDRLIVSANENIFMSQAGDYFNFWPDKATEVLDSDSFGRVATSNEVSLINFMVPFRKVLFATAAKTQFELSAGQDLLTGRTANLDPSTSYEASILCRPLMLGDSLYFAAQTDQDAVVFEYDYDDSSLSNTAGDITKHCGGYLPASLIRIAGDTVTGTLVTLSNTERNSLYVLRYYWDGEKRVQNAWGRWTFGNDETEAFIHGMQIIGGYLYLVVRRGTETFLEKMLLSTEFNDESSKFQIAFTVESGREIRWPIRLDRRQAVTGTYNAGTNKTTWTLGYDHGSSLIGILSEDFSTPGRQLQLTFPTTTTVAATGDFSAGDVVFGKSYELRVRLSKQYIRTASTDGTGRSITSGRLQLRTFSFDYRDTGYFEVQITPYKRPTRVYKFTGRVIGSSDNQIGVTPISEGGTFRVTNVNGRGDTTVIEIVNGSHVPTTITSAYWVGFFNEITRQE